jgi:hypothetical protein
MNSLKALTSTLVFLLSQSALSQPAGVTAPVFACFAEIATLENRAQNVDHATFAVYSEKAEESEAQSLAKPRGILIAKVEVLTKRKRSAGFYFLTEHSLSCHALEKPQLGQAMGKTYRSWSFQLPAEKTSVESSKRAYVLVAGKSKDNPESGEAYSLQTTKEPAKLTKQQSCLDPKGPEMKALQLRLASILSDLHLDPNTQKPLDREKLVASTEKLRAVTEACAKVSDEKIQARVGELRDLINKNSAETRSSLRSSKVAQ